MKKSVFLLLIATVTLSMSAFALEQGYDQFKNTKVFMTFHHNGKPALHLGETYELQTGKKMKDLIGRSFKFLLEDGSVKKAKIEKLKDGQMQITQV